MAGEPPHTVLMADDDLDDCMLAEEAFAESGTKAAFSCVLDGVELMDYLAERSRVSPADLPRLILLDLSLPGADGFSILGQIRSLEAENALTLTPVVIFSDSQTAADITRSYRCGANSYIMKPLSFLDFRAVVKAVGQYWMTHNRTCS